MEWGNLWISLNWWTSHLTTSITHFFDGDAGPFSTTKLATPR
jgi:hypothetical protein